MNGSDRYRSIVARHPYLDNVGPIAFAHRGGAGVHPENSMAAFAHSIDLGFTHLETDVHATADGRAVAFHDDHLDRVTDAVGRISELPWSQVSKARIDGREPIPLLEELLARFSTARFNLDPKSDDAVGPMVDVIERTNAIDRVCVTSFSGRRTARVLRALGPGLCHGAGPLGIVSVMLRSVRVPVPGPRSQVAQVPMKRGPIPIVTPRFVRAAHRCDIAVHVWTIDDRADIERLLDLGVDGIMTDRPEVLKAALVARQLWPAAASD